MKEHHAGGSFEQGVMVDVGPGFGALVIYGRTTLLGHEVEISPSSDDSNRMHTDFLRRRTSTGQHCAAVFGSLPEGEYRLWGTTVTQPSNVRIVGGEVAEIDWR